MLANVDCLEEYSCQLNFIAKNCLIMQMCSLKVICFVGLEKEMNDSAAIIGLICYCFICII